MSSKRRLRRRACGSKIPYPTEHEAINNASKLRKWYEGGSWVAYKCKWCGSWHVGRPSARDRQATRDRRAAAAE